MCGLDQVTGHVPKPENSNTVSIAGKSEKGL